MTATPPAPLSFPDLTVFTSEDGASGFRCEEEALNRFFQQEAGQQGRRDENRTWVLRRPPDRTDLPLVLGFYTLTTTSIERSSLPSSVTKRLPNNAIRAILIGRLGRDERCKRLGVGERLLDDDHRRALRVNSDLGSLLVVVDAKSERAAAFYREYDYSPLIRAEAEDGRWPQRFYVTMGTLRASYEVTTP